MPTTLEHIYDNLISPGDAGRPTNPEYTAKNRLLTEQLEAFSETLDKKKAKELEDIFFGGTEVFDLEARQAFVVGFRMGAKMILEVLENRDNRT